MRFSRELDPPDIRKESCASVIRSVVCPKGLDIRDSKIPGQALRVCTLQADLVWRTPVEQACDFGCARKVRMKTTSRIARFAFVEQRAMTPVHVFLEEQVAVLTLSIQGFPVVSANQWRGPKREQLTS